MRLTAVLSVLVLTILLVSGSADAGVYVFEPNPPDMYDLDHHYYYTWGIDWTLPDEVISDVRLTFTNINNWRTEPNALFVHLLDDARSGVSRLSDNVDAISDQFAGQGTMVGTYTDLAGGPGGDVINLTYSFRDLGILSNFISYAADGRFAIGFDPDCHYWNDGIKLTVVTGTPEPGTLVLLGLGLAGGAILRRKKTSV